MKTIDSGIFYSPYVHIETKYLIDPTRITNYNLNDEGLAAHLIFWICVAGKTAATIAPAVNKLLISLRNKHKMDHPFLMIRKERNLKRLLKKNGIGCMTLKARALKYLASAQMDLRTCTVEELDEVPGIGPKTARCFVLHTRKNAKVAGLDTHVLKFLRDLGFDAPKSTPTSAKTYNRLEEIFLDLAERVELMPATLDLAVWNAYSGKDKGEIEELLERFK